MKKTLSLLLALVLAVTAFSTNSLAWWPLEVEGPITEYPFSAADAYQKWWMYWDRYKGQLERHDWIIGDVNLDGRVDAADALFALHYAVDQEEILDGKFKPAGMASYLCLFITRGHYAKDYRHMVSASHGVMAMTNWNMWALTCYYNSLLMSDVTGNCSIDAADAQGILQYAVGKRTAFARTDFSGNDEYYFVPYVADWKPCSICVNATPDFESEYYPVDESLIPDWETYVGIDGAFFIH